VNTIIANSAHVFSTENNGQWATEMSHGTNHKYCGEWVTSWY